MDYILFIDIIASIIVPKESNTMTMTCVTRCTRGDASSFFLYLQNVFVHVCTKQNLS